MTEINSVREIRCVVCGTKYELRIYKRAGEDRVEIDTACPVCPPRTPESPERKPLND